MKNFKLTNDEKFAIDNIENGVNFNLAKDIDSAIAEDKKREFNEELDKYVEEFSKHQEELHKACDNMGVDPSKLEIKPMKDHVLIRPFEHNPFQKFEEKNGLIVDSGGFRVNVDKNPMTGKYEEQPQQILTAAVVDCGPEVKYLKQGDVVFFHKRNILPVPFFKQGLWDLPEYQVLAVVNEGLTDRWNENV